MKVTLAVEYNDGKKTHAPDTTIDVDTRTARSLIAVGRAREADESAARTKAAANTEKKEG